MLHFPTLPFRPDISLAPPDTSFATEKHAATALHTPVYFAYPQSATKVIER